LNLLVDQLPCSAKLKTIVSDDDIGLAAAFAHTEDPRITGLHRVVCFWHKVSAFVRPVGRSPNKLRMIELFRRLGATRHVDEYARCSDEIVLLSGPLVIITVNSGTEQEYLANPFIFPRDLNKDEKPN
jgi:hypothetical protein